MHLFNTLMASKSICQSSKISKRQQKEKDCYLLVQINAPRIPGVSCQMVEAWTAMARATRSRSEGIQGREVPGEGARGWFRIRTSCGGNLWVIGHGRGCGLAGVRCWRRRSRRPQRRGRFLRRSSRRWRPSTWASTNSSLPMADHHSPPTADAPKSVLPSFFWTPKSNVILLNDFHGQETGVVYFFTFTRANL